MKKYKAVRTDQPAIEGKLCFRCQKHKSLASFHNDKRRPDGKYPYCRACRRRYISAAKGRVRITDDFSKVCGWCEAPIGGTHANLKYCSETCKGRAMRVHSYGLLVEEYKDLIESMGGLCPICKRKVSVWHMDHNHETGETFGPVCTTCNTKLLAWTFHNPEVAKRLTEFLENPPVRARHGGRYVTAKRANATAGHKGRRAARAEQGIYDFPHGLTR